MTEAVAEAVAHPVDAEGTVAVVDEEVAEARAQAVPRAERR